MFRNLPRNLALLLLFTSTSQAVKGTTTQCTKHDHCEKNEICHEFHCTNSCKLGFCGTGASCWISNHQIDCYCPKNHAGNPYEACLLQSGSFDNFSVISNLTFLENNLNIILKVGNTSDEASCEDVVCGVHSFCKVHGTVVSCICEDGWAYDPTNVTAGCEDIDECNEIYGSGGKCGENEVCINTIGSFHCLCLEGFVYAATDENDPNNRVCKAINHSQCDESNPCPQGEKCALFEDGKNICSCLPGYARVDRMGQCIDVDECSEYRSNSTCGVNAICKNLPGSYECHCPLGYHGNPFSLCEQISKVECFSDKECPNDEVCRKGRCMDACLGTCGINAECIAINHRAMCSCPVQTTGDPFTKCVKLEGCTGGNECGAKETCINNTCVNPCRLQNICGENTTCTVVNQKARCACLREYNGDPSRGCSKLSPCRGSWECPKIWQTCSYGTCAAVCSSDKDCSSNEVCLKKTCIRPCQSNLDCASFQTCRFEICRKQMKFLGFLSNMTEGVKTKTRDTLHPTNTTNTSITIKSNPPSEKSEVNIFVYVLAAMVTVSFVVILTLVVYIRVKQTKVISPQEECEFREGKTAESGINSYTDFHVFSEQYDALKYEVGKYEIDKDRVELIGGGNFGLVYKTYMPRFKGDVAIKLPKSIYSINAADEVRSILCEIKIMSYVGSHPNILKLLGAYTKEIKRGYVVIITELCENGSLLNYLRKIPSHPGARLGNEEIYTLCRFCQEIANGMDYLAEKNVIHGDLSARNVLLGEDLICKVSDFGLSRKLNWMSEIYNKKTREPLPWAWMAVEALGRLQFSLKSDIHSMGVTFWEIFTCGRHPHATEKGDEEYVEKLMNGLKLGKPEHCNDEIYEMISRCWQIDPALRPRAKEFVAFFQNQRGLVYTNV